LALFRKYSRRTLVLAGLGLIITVVLVAYLVLTDSYRNPPHELSTPLLVAFLVLCPPSLLSVAFIDAETGTSGFYFIWFFVGLINAGLYSAVGAAVAHYVRVHR
jgi:FtsH-binding integral membrane protein